MDSQEGGVSYEDIRKQRLEENKKRMQELGLTDLSKNLSNGMPASKTTPQVRQIKPRIPKEFVELRRSSRVASNPAPDYREVDADSSLGRRSYSSRASSLLNRKYASDEARLEAALQAESIMKELPKKNPSFVKPMLQSHVTGGFWLGLPSMFCKTYLPQKDDKIVLENDKGDEWDTVFLANKAGLSGGWRGFSLDHGLVDGDALVFELVERCRFKIHIVRASEEAQDEEDESEEEPVKGKGKINIVQKYKVKKQQDIEEAQDEEDESEEEPVKGKGKINIVQKYKVKKQQDLEETAPLKTKTKKKQAAKEQVLDAEESKKEPEKKASAKKDPIKKKRKAKYDDLEDLFEIQEEEDYAEPTTGNQITSFMRAGKPHLARVSKKPMPCGDVISVC